MIKLNMPVIVEGKYDKITLENVIDALIIPTDGFSVFKDKEKCELIRLFARREGVIVLTDSDSAGNMIRAHIKNIVNDGKIINVYVPKQKGKEKRKSTASKEGFLGVEGFSKEVLTQVFQKYGIATDVKKPTAKITKTDLFLCGLSGTENAKENREKLLKYLDLPSGLSANAFMDVLNTLLSREEFEKAVSQCQNLGDKSLK